MHQFFVIIMIFAKWEVHVFDENSLITFFFSVE